MLDVGSLQSPKAFYAYFHVLLAQCGTCCIERFKFYNSIYVEHTIPTLATISKVLIEKKNQKVSHAVLPGYS